MTLTETRPETDPEHARAALPATDQSPAATWVPPTGLAGVLGTSDHTLIGRMYVLFAVMFSGLALGLGFLMSLEKTDISAVYGFFGDANELFQVFGLYRTTLILCGLVPLFLGLATAIIPKQLQATTVAYPRASAAAFWMWLIGAFTHLVATFAYGGLGSLQVGAAREASVELTVLSLGMVALGLLVGAGVILATLVTQRPAGMDLLQMPAFSWSMLVATGVWLFSLPVLLANLMIVWVDMRGVEALRFGASDAPFVQVSWAFDAPQVYAWTIPLLGIASEVFTSAHRSRPKLFEPMAALVGVFGFLSFGAWAQSFFNDSDLSAVDAHVVTDQVVFVAYGLGIALVVLAFLGWLAYNAVTSGQRPEISPQFGFVVLAGVLLTAAVLAGVLRVAGPALGVLREADAGLWAGFFDAMDDLSTSSLVTGMMNLAVLAGVLAGLAGLFHWAPRVLGGHMSEPLGFLAVLTLGGGALLYGLADVFAGFFDQPDRFFAGANLDAIDAVRFVEFLNVVGLMGVFAVVVGFVVVAVDLAFSVQAKGDG